MVVFGVRGRQHKFAVGGANFVVGDEDVIVAVVDVVYRERHFVREVLYFRFFEGVLHSHIEFVIVGQAGVVAVAVIWDFVVVVIIKTYGLGVGDARIEIPIYLGGKARGYVVERHQMDAMRDAVVGNVLVFI